MQTGIRRQARVVALQTLYEYDASQHGVDVVLARHIAERQLTARVQEFATALAHGVLAHLGEIDALIEGAAHEWPLNQMARIDRNILRLAIYEIVFDNAVPAKAAINEAVELAKTFGSDTSRRFVNGVLGTIVNQSPGSPASTSESEVR